MWKKIEAGTWHESRPAILQNVRQEVKRKTGGICFYRGYELHETWHVDHFQPRSKGGEDEVNNYVPACVPCNLRKHDRLPTVDEMARLRKLTMALSRTFQS